MDDHRYWLGFVWRSAATDWVRTIRRWEKKKKKKNGKGVLEIWGPFFGVLPYLHY